MLFPSVTACPGCRPSALLTRLDVVNHSVVVFHDFMCLFILTVSSWFGHSQFLLSDWFILVVQPNDGLPLVSWFSEGSDEAAHPTVRLLLAVFTNWSQWRHVVFTRPPRMMSQAEKLGRVSNKY